jgi:hypothetical protein
MCRSNSDCASGFCDDGTCNNSPRIHQPCKGDKNCPSGMKCQAFSSTCVPPKYTMKDPCTNSSDCPSMSYCADTGKCLIKLWPGDKCDMSSDNCADGYKCSDVQKKTPICKARCRPLESDCFASETCQRGVCVPKKKKPATPPPLEKNDEPTNNPPPSNPPPSDPNTENPPAQNEPNSQSSYQETPLTNTTPIYYGLVVGAIVIIIIIVVFTIKRRRRVSSRAVPPPAVPPFIPPSQMDFSYTTPQYAPYHPVSGSPSNYSQPPEYVPSTWNPNQSTKQ